MTSNELKKLRELVEKEKERIKNVNKLQEFEAVKEYLELVGLEPQNLDDSTRSILMTVLKNFAIKKTNGIYVCTSATRKESEVIYQDTLYHEVNVSLDSPSADYKWYRNIEDGLCTQRLRIKQNLGYETIEEFEKSHIVLNPTNKTTNSNGYLAVRLDFFENALLYGQSKSKKLLIDKYNRIQTGK